VGGLLYFGCPHKICQALRALGSSSGLDFGMNQGINLTLRLACPSSARALTDVQAHATLFGARVVSSVGRAVVSKTTGRRFEPCTARQSNPLFNTGDFSLMSNFRLVCHSAQRRRSSTALLDPTAAPYGLGSLLDPTAAPYGLLDPNHAPIGQDRLGRFLTLRQHLAGFVLRVLCFRTLRHASRPTCFMRSMCDMTHFSAFVERSSEDCTVSEKCLRIFPIMNSGS
jgi:hypothetical protein